MVMGDTCTRGCRFCCVSTAAKPLTPDPEEPKHLAETISTLGLDYIVLTTVCRDDLPDQGAYHLAECLREIRRQNPSLLLEVLMQDFRGDIDLIRIVAHAGAHVLAHNLETVKRLTPTVRDHKASYQQSLDVLRALKEFRPNSKTKSSLMLGLGESEAELRSAFSDLRDAGVDILTLGQYLRPDRSARYLPVARYLAPGEFDSLGQIARDMGFLYVASGPFVRSSYRAGELYLKGLLEARHAT
jgi:lipoic acid synthetase